MAKIPNTAAQTVSDGQNTYWNVDTLNAHAQLTNADFSATQSATAPDPGAAGTIATAGVVVARVSPAAARTGIILAAGTQPGQLCIVVNEAAAANSLTFNTAPATANVADSANEPPIYGLTARVFIWDSVQSLWYSAGNFLLNGTQATLQSATAPDPGAAGTIATANVGVARVSPAAARAAVILAAGTIPGQEVWVVNEAAAVNTITFDVQATSHVADGAGAAIAGLTARKFVWDSSTSLWYRAA